MSPPSERDAHSVAIMGLSCRLPGDGDNLDNFWELICQGRSAWSEVPKERFNIDAFHSPSKKHNTSITRGGHFLKQDIATFDANFFSFSKVEAISMDPQHRAMIEVTYEALEKAGLALHEIAGTRTGVFMGNFTSDYREMVFRDPESAPAYTASGISKTSLANRISWLFDLQGPSFTLDTACSSSMVALHLACQSLRTGESDIAIVGGGNLLLNPEVFVYWSNQGFLSPDGKCKSFDDSADGYGRGEGFAAVVLKRVDDAIFDGDPIRAVIRGTGSNQDGHTKGFTLPSAEAQANLIRDTYRQAGLDFSKTHYVEAHGTGTQAGDTQETEALSKTISKGRSPMNKLLVGSVKSNIGHLEAAAGLAAVVKAVLMLERGMIPPTINQRKRNPKIKFDEWHLDIPTTLRPWPVDGLRRISANSFGFGGTNAHAIIDDAYHYLKARGLQGNHYTSVPGDTACHLNSGVPKSLLNGHANRLTKDISTVNGLVDHQRPRLFVLSAQDKEGLKRVQLSLAPFLESKVTELEDHTEAAQTYLRNLAYTLSRRRSQLQWKTFSIASSLKQLSQQLNDEEANAVVHRSTRQPRIGFVFTGQGAQWPRMGLELMRYSPFTESVHAADEYLRIECHCSWSLIRELEKGKSSSQLHLAAYSQTLCTVLQVALVDLLKFWGLTPSAVVGHSSGEIGAAYCLGALSREDAWKIAYYRGILSSNMKTAAPELDGAMMAVGISPQQAEKWISQVKKGEIVIACINSPSSVTISGDAAGIDELLDMLKAEGIFARRLQVDTAYHSPHMQVIAQEYFEALADIEPKSPAGSCKMHSSVIGSLIEPNDLGATNWVRNLTSPVQFSAAVHDMIRPLQNGKRLDENALDVLVEVGPHPALQGPAIQTLKEYGITNVPYYSAIVRNQDAVHTALELVGLLCGHGAQLNILRVNDDVECRPRLLVDLPLYPWNHLQRYWAESRIGKEYRLRKQPCLSLLGAPTPSLAQGEHVWRKFIRLSEERWISDHKIQSSVVYPGAGFVAMALEAAHQIADPNQRIADFRLRNVQFLTAAVISEESDLEILLQLRPHTAGAPDNASTWMDFNVMSSPDGQTLQRNCTGLLIVDYEPEEGSDASHEKALESESFQKQCLEAAQLCTNQVSLAQFYEDLTAVGLVLGPTFTNMTDIRNTDGKAFCVVEVADTPMHVIEALQHRPHIIHPGTLDAIFQMAFAAVHGGKHHLGRVMVPRAVDEIVISANAPFQPGVRLSGYATAEKHGFKDLTSDILMLDEETARPVVNIVNFICTPVGGASSDSTNDATKKICSKLTWKPAIQLLSADEKSYVIERQAAKCGVGNNELNELYSNSEGVKAILNKLFEYLRLRHHTNPDLRVLEIVAASGTSSPLLFLPGMHDVEQILATAEYTISCENEEAMKNMKDRLSHLKGAVKYAVLDIVNDSNTQKLSDAKFDVIMTFNTSSTFDQLDVALSNAKKLLKEGGEICLIEITNPDLRLSMLASSAASNSLKATQELLHRSGFTGDMTLYDFDEPKLRQVRLLVAGFDADAVVDTGVGEVTLIEAAKPSDTARAISTQLARALDKLGYKTRSFVWGSDVAKLKKKSCIALMELETPLLSAMSEQDFNSLQQLIRDSASLLWVVGLDGPSGGMIAGLARVVRNETPGISFRTLNIEPTALASPDRLGALISRTFGSRIPDAEFMIKDGVICVSRIEEDLPLSDELQSLLPDAGKKISKLRLSQAPGPLKLSVQSPGMLDTLCFEPDDLPNAELEGDQIEIQVKATALNFREVMSVMGQIPDKLLGFDASGIVHRVGSAVTKFKVNDKVAMYGHGSHRTVHRSKADYCELIPEGLSFEQAATIPLVHGTAWYGLVELARVKKRQSILIHAAAGGVGQAAIQIAKHFEMEIFATVGSEAERKLLRETYEIPNDHILNSRDLSFVKGIQRMTGGRGVDVILNQLSGEALRQTWYCIAPFGTFLEIGIKDILNNTELDMRPFLQDATFSFFNLNHIEKARPDIMARIIQGVFDFQRRGITRPITPLTVYPVSEIESAFRLMQTDEHLGKIALSYSADDVVPVINMPAVSFQADPNAAYLLVGGLGGLGRSIATMLVDHGVRKLCFLSRSGGTSAEAQKLIQDLSARQVQVQAYACDVADEAATAGALARCTKDLGPVRGVIQCAMLLRDALFVNMSYQQWIESIRPKVQATWNLHQHLKDVDFFVVLGSFAAIFGNRGQANYAAGCAYQDAIAHYRRSQDLHAVTIDLGLMRDVGVLAEKGITESLREWELPYGIREIEFHALLKRAIAGDINGDIAPQVITGLATGGSAMAAGINAPYYLDEARFSIMAKTGVRDQSATETQSTSVPTQQLVAQATSLQEASEHVTEALVNRVAKMLQTSHSEIDTGRFLHSYGVDSLTAIEVVNWALKELKAVISVIDVMASLPITSTARKIASNSAILPKEIVLQG